jgi:large subunit ribosomal protein L4
MKIDLLTSSAKKSDITISEATFGKDFNESLVHQAVVSYMAGSRQGSSKQKTRSEVRGGGKKPYRQKGTGRARAGTIRSPLWRGGGVAFAATPRDYSKKINKKMYRAALRSIFSELLRQGKLVAIETPVLEKPKTKEIAKFLKDFSLSKVLFITDKLDINFIFQQEIYQMLTLLHVREINPVILLKPQKVAVTSVCFEANRGVDLMVKRKTLYS